MPSPPIQVFLTTIASQPALRQRQEYILRILQVKKIPFTSYDLASDENAKRLWRRKAPADKAQLPGILVGGAFPGVFADFEEAVECGELNTFLRLDESWDPDMDGPAPVQAAPIGVPGAVMPLEMTPEHIRKQVLLEQKASPLRGKGTPVNKRDDLFDVSNELSGFGLQGVQVSEQDLLDLVAELGLEDDGDLARDLAKGLVSASSPREPKAVENDKPDAVVQNKPEAAVEDKPEAVVEDKPEAVVEDKPQSEGDRLKDTSGPLDAASKEVEDKQSTTAVGQD